MTLPAIFEPSGLPAFLAAGLAIDPEDIYATLARGSGRDRKRRVFTTGPRRVTVARLLTPAQAAAYQDWFEGTIVVGETHFSAWISKFGVGQEWWDACWLSMPNWDPMPSPQGVLWRMTGELLLSGAPSDVRPEDGLLGVEYVARLTGSAEVVVPIELGVEYEAHLSPATALGVEYAANLVSVEPHFLLIGDGFFLKIDSTHRLRIG